MESTFTENQLVRFGQYLLSQERKNRFKRSKKNGNQDSPTTARQSLALVHHADVENFKTFVTENPEVQFTASKEVILR